MGREQVSGCQGTRMGLVGRETQIQGGGTKELFCDSASNMYFDCGGDYTNLYMEKVHKTTHTHTQMNAGFTMQVLMSVSWFLYCTIIVQDVTN